MTGTYLKLRQPQVGYGGMGVFTLDELVADYTSADEVLEASQVRMALEVYVALEYSLQAQSQPEGIVAHQQSDDLVLQTC